jgi:hypothetical protein
MGIRFEKSAIILLLLGIFFGVICQYRLEQRLNTIIERL